MIDERFIWVGAILLLVGAFLYVRDVFLGKVRPNIVTWFLWALAPMIAFAAQVQSGISSAAMFTFVVGFCPAVVCVATFKKGFVKLTWFDYVCGGMSLLALLAWQLTKDGTWAIVFSIAADCLAAVPTLVKSFREPSSESPLLFGLFIVSAAITLLIIKSWTIENAAFASYIFILYAVLFVLVRFRLGLYFKKARVSANTFS